jgi:3',5'-cyclic AMP phosphodiesterase CpdA
MAFLLAHLSDPHLAPLPAPRWFELAGKRATGYLNWHRKRRLVHDAGVLAGIVADLKAHKPDHIAVTGDLANISLPGEFTRGRAWLDAIGRPAQVSLVPGNHDAYVSAGLDHSAREWSAYMSGDESTGFPYLRRRGPLALIGLSSAVPTAPFMATGRLGGEQLAALATLLDGLKQEGLFRVLLIHHPPVSKAPRHKRLLDAAALLHVIATHGADLLLHGHDHLAMLNWLAGPDGTRVPAVGVPPASAAQIKELGATKHAAAYNLYRIEGGPNAWRCEMTVRSLSPSGGIEEQSRVMLAG